MKRWQIIAAATGTVLLLTGGTALAVAPLGDGPTPNTTVSPTPATQPMQSMQSKPKIGAEQAGKLAVAKVGGGSIDDIERETEHGRQEWDVEVIKAGKEYDVRVDANTGTITRFRADDDSDDRDDRSDDRDDRDDRSDDRDDRSDDDRGSDDRDDRDDRDD